MKGVAAAVAAAAVATVAGWVAFVWTWCARDRFDHTHWYE